MSAVMFQGTRWRIVPWNKLELYVNGCQVLVWVTELWYMSANLASLSDPSSKDAAIVIVIDLKLIQYQHWHI